MAVDEAYRGMGIGHFFFDKIKEIKAEKKLDGIELQVNAKNKAAYELTLLDMINNYSGNNSRGILKIERL